MIPSDVRTEGLTESAIKNSWQVEAATLSSKDGVVINGEGIEFRAIQRQRESGQLSFLLVRDRTARD